MTSLALPSMPSGLTAQWLTGALQYHGVLPRDVAISGLELEQVGEGVGMMSELSRLVPSYTGDAKGLPPSFIAKYPSQNATNREVAMTMNLYEREVGYFVQLDPLTTAQSPKTYLAEIEGDNFILLLEDLADYEVGDQIVGATLAQTELAIDELAKLHAPFWDKVPDIPWLPRVANSDYAANLHAGAIAGWEPMLKTFGAFLPQSFIEQKEVLLNAIPQLKARMNQAPITLVHGDFRMENLLYGTAPDHYPLAIIDWQGPMLGRGMMDVTLLMGQSTQTEVRRAHERALVARYVQGLAALGVQGYDQEEAWDDYRHAHLHSWVYAIVVSGTLDASNARAFAWMSKMIQRQVAVTEDLSLLELLPTAA